MWGAGGRQRHTLSQRMCKVWSVVSHVVSDKETLNLRDKMKNTLDNYRTFLRSNNLMINEKKTHSLWMMPRQKRTRLGEEDNVTLRWRTRR